MMTIEQYCQEAMCNGECTLTYTDKDGITHTLTGNQRIETVRGCVRNNAILNIVSFDNGRSYYIEVKAYSSIIAVMKVNPGRDEVYILKAMITSVTDTKILSEVADCLSLMGVGAYYLKGKVWCGGGPITYFDFKAAAKASNTYSIRHDSPILRKGGYC